ncbi:DUF481 domain-containing protein [Oceanicaulis sp. LC35]|uniref:DUF481 domain-containing protein n=1 Tax=Oceanicaulis sp. LC35 TaxID=3349635 RepID=UPI003F83DC83
MILTAFAALSLAASPAEGLEPPFQELLAAAAAEDNEAVFINAVTLLALTQPAQRIARGAARLSDRHAVLARRTLGLPIAPVTPAPPPAMIAVDTELQDAAEANELTSKVDPFWIAAPASAMMLLTRAESELWTGKIRLGVRADSGDSDRLDYTIGLDAERELVGWGFETSAIYSYSEVDGNVGRDELILKARGEREAGERWTLFTNTEWERDQISGFDWTGFLGVGAGYRALQRDKAEWTIRAAPGVRYIQEVDNGSYYEGAFDLLSDVELQLSDTMRLESETRFLASNSARADQLFKLNTDLGDLWSLEVRYRYRYEFNPEPGFEAGDSRTDLALVREF